MNRNTYIFRVWGRLEGEDKARMFHSKDGLAIIGGNPRIIGPDGMKYFHSGARVMLQIGIDKNFKPVYESDIAEHRKSGKLNLVCVKDFQAQFEDQESMAFLNEYRVIGDPFRNPKLFDEYLKEAQERTA